MIRRRFLIAAALLSVFALGWWVGRGRATSDLYANLDLFVEVLHKIEDNYVDPVNAPAVIQGGIRGMLRELDPFSLYLDEKSYRNLKDVTQGKFGGIGVEVSIRDNYPTVIAPLEGSPAWQAGILSGDVIVRIDGTSSAGFTVEDAASRLRGPEGTSVRVSVHRDGDDEEHDFVLQRREIVLRSVPYAFVSDDHVGYVRLSSFSESSASELRAAVQRLRAQGAKSLVLDLRQNPGGLLDQAVDVAEQFLPKGELVVYTRGRSRGQDNRYYTSEAHAEKLWPMVVLVDHGTASASEIVAGALQDRDRALVIGQTSYGKGSVQSVFPLRGRTAALKLTTALYYTPSGRSIHRATHADVEDDEDDDEDESDADSAVVATPDDTTSRPVFLTLSGRKVFGGGGITPDVPVAPDTLPALAQRIEQRGLAFRFSTRWANAHPGERVGASIGETGWRQFEAFLRAEKLPFEESELDTQRGILDLALRRELARRAGGDSAAARVVLGSDRLFQRAKLVLTHSRGPSDVFVAALAQGAAPSRAGSTDAKRRDATAPRPRSRKSRS